MPDRRRVVGVALADFRQRIRSPRLVGVLVIVAVLGYMVTVGDVELVFQDQTGPHTFDNYQGVNNAPWVGLKAGLTGAFFFGIGGFYLFKGTLARDRKTGVGKLAASTPVSDGAYLLGKWLSHVALGVVIVATLGVATVINHAVHGVGPTDPVAILVPITLLGLPAGGVVGGVALLFETNRWLDGTLGNVVYFFAVLSLMPILLSAQAANGGVHSPAKYLDLFGMTAVYSVAYDGIAAVAPGYDGGVMSFGQVFGESTTFVWEGGGWPAWALGQRAVLVVAGATVALAATVTFDRFGSTTSRRSGFLPPVSIPNPVSVVRNRRGDSTPSDSTDPGDVTLTPVENRDGGNPLGLYLAELRMALRGQRWWWYAGVIGLVLGGWVASPGTARVVLLAALVWPLFVWSSLGFRPARNGTLPFVVSSRHPYAQLAAEWAAGVTVGAIVFSGVAATLLTAGQVGALAGVVAAVTFPPSLALAAGAWAETSRVFELTYLLLWYVGPANGVVPLDFAGVSHEAVAGGTPSVFLAAGGALLTLAFVRRRRRVP